MWTSCFKNFRADNGVAICLFPPNYWEGERYPDLYPNMGDFFDAKLGRIDREEFKRRYLKKLEGLDPRKVLKDLDGKVLLCFEPPVWVGDDLDSSAGFCHRHLVSKWIKQKTGKEVKEWRKPRGKNLLNI